MPRSIGFKPLIRAVFIVTVVIPLVLLVLSGRCVPVHYEMFGFRPATIKGEWGEAAISGNGVRRRDGMTITSDSPYHFSFLVDSTSNSSTHFTLKQVDFVDAGNGTLVTRLEPDISRPFHTYPNATLRYSGARLPEVALPHADYVVTMTFEIASDTTVTEHVLTFNLPRTYESYWSTPMWEAYRGV